MVHLSFADWLMLAEAWGLLILFHLALRWTSYERLIRSNHPAPVKFPRTENDLGFVQRMQRLVGIAARLHLAPIACLDKSLALQRMLSRRKIYSQIKIGVQKIQNETYAHAWVEVDGLPIGEVEGVARKFKVLESIQVLNHRQFI